MAFGELVALLQLYAVHNGTAQTLVEGDQVALFAGSAVVVHTGHYHMLALLVLDVDGAGDLGHDGQSLGTTRFEQLLNAGKTLGDILGRRDTAGMEGTHGQLGTGLTDGLGGDNTHSLAQTNRQTVGQVGAVAAGAGAVLGAAVQNAADLQLGDTGLLDLFGVEQVHHLVLADDQLASLGMIHIVYSVTAYQTLMEGLDHAVAFADGGNHDALGGAAVLFPDDHVLRNVYQTAGQVTGVGGTQSGIGQTLTSASAGNEIFQNVQAFAVVGANGHLDGVTGGVGQ